MTDPHSDVVFPPTSSNYEPILDIPVDVNSLTVESSQYYIMGSGSASLTVDGATLLEGIIATGSAPQTYNGPVTLGKGTDEIFKSGMITFNSTVDSVSPGGAVLLVDAPVTFNGPVGASDPLYSLYQDQSYPWTINTPEIELVRAALFKGPVTLQQDTSISAGYGTDFQSTIDGAYSLTVHSTVGFDGAVGGSTPLTSLTVDGPATVSAPVTTTGSQTYEQSANLSSPLSASVVTVDGTATANGPLTIDGAATFAGGADGVTDLATTGSLSLTGGTIDLTGNLDAGGGVQATGGSVSFDATSGTEQIQGPRFTFAGLKIAGGNTLDLNGNSVSVADLTGGGAVTDSGSAATLTADPSDTDSFGGTIEGAISLTMDGTGTLNLSGPLTYSGSTNVSSGTLGFQVDPVGLGSITDDGQLMFDLPADSTYGGVISGSGGVAQLGSGTLTLTGANTYSGTTAVDDGAIGFLVPGNLGSGQISLDGGGLQWGSGNTSDISSRLNAIGPKGASFDVGTGRVTMASPIIGTGALTKLGSGALELADTDGDAAPTVVQDGNLTLDAGSVLTGPLDIEKGGTAEISGYLDSALSVNGGSVTCAGGTLNGGVTSSGGTFSGAPGAPVISSVTAGRRSATVDFNESVLNCRPVTYTVTATPSGQSASNTGDSITVLGLRDHTSYTFTVTATNPMGSTTSQPSTQVTTAAGPPTAMISSPVANGRYTLDQKIATSFSCAEAAGGPGLSSCVDVNGTTGGRGHLDTSSVGKHTYVVAAVSQDGLKSDTSISYTVVPPNSFTLRAARTGQKLVNSCGVAHLKLMVPWSGRVNLLEAGPKGMTFGKAAPRPARAETLKLTVKPSRQGARLVRRHRRLSLTMTVSFTPHGGTTRTKVIRGIRVRGQCAALR